MKGQFERSDFSCLHFEAGSTRSCSEFSYLSLFSPNRKFTSFINLLEISMDWKSESWSWDTFVQSTTTSTEVSRKAVEHFLVKRRALELILPLPIFSSDTCLLRFSDRRYRNRQKGWNRISSKTSLSRLRSGSFLGSLEVERSWIKIQVHI